jgi:hypothetical protein
MSAGFKTWQPLTTLAQASDLDKYLHLSNGAWKTVSFAARKAQLRCHENLIAGRKQSSMAGRRNPRLAAPRQGGSRVCSVSREAFLTLHATLAEMFTELF